MAKKTDEPEPGEQLDLIDTQPESAKAIARQARRYKKVVRERMALTEKEVAEKDKLREMVREAGITPDADGKAKFTADGVKIKVTFQEEKISVTLPDDEDDGE